MTPLPLRFVLSVPGAGALPDSRAEVAVVGRSNVGKSSLINALANRKALAQVSKTPGRTRLINLYELADGATFVDLPGYGYAAVSGSTRKGWGSMVEDYLRAREPLRMILVLVDGEIGPTKLDVTMLEWLRHHDLPFAVVATKHDKVKASTRDRRKRELPEACGVAHGEVTWVSAAKGTGIVELRTKVRAWLASPS